VSLSDTSYKELSRGIVYGSMFSNLDLGVPKAIARLQMIWK
jgi:hypothetical protein